MTVLNTESEIGRRVVDRLAATGLPLKTLRDETHDDWSIIVVEYNEAHLSDGQRVLIELAHAYDRALQFVGPETLDEVILP